MRQNTSLVVGRASSAVTFGYIFFCLNICRCSETQVQPETTAPAQLEQNQNSEIQVKKTYSVVSKKRFDYDEGQTRIKRQVISIDIGDNYNEQEISTALQQAFDLEKDSGLDAIRVLAFRKSNPKKSGSIFAVGNLIHAPNAKWEDAAKRSNFLTEIEITAKNKVGEKQKVSEDPEARIVSEDSKKVGLYSSPKDLVDENLITKLRVGTKVEIIEKKEEYMTATYKWCVYKIKVKRKVGWVFCSDVSMQ